MSGYLPQLVSILREGGVRGRIPENTEETGLCPGVGLKGGGGGVQAPDLGFSKDLVLEGIAA